MATDDEDGASNPPTLTLSGTDASDFTLTLTDGNGNGTYELAFKVVPDFEMAADAGRNNVYNITVTATDSDEQTDTMAVVVTVTNEEEDGTVTLNTLQPRVGIGVMATLTDLDGATTDVTWKWQGQGRMSQTALRSPSQWMTPPTTWKGASQGPTRPRQKT